MALVAAHFVPSNLTGVHRARLWATYLPEFGWEPVVVTTDWKYYEEAPDWDLMALLPQGLEVIRTPALPIRPIRWIGDMGIRGLFWHYRALCKLAREKRVDFLHITIPSAYSALLGRLVRSATGLQYGIDYIDPWVHRWPGTEKILSKAWVSCKLGEWLEPWAVRQASLITGVGPLYYEDMLLRNPEVRTRAVVAAMPYGSCPEDHVRARNRRPGSALFDPADGLFHMVYAGAMLPKAYPVLQRFLEALVMLVDRQADVARKLRVHFIGSGRSPQDPRGHSVMPLVAGMGLQGIVDEHPQRVAYLDVLAYLAQSSAVLVLGSTERHYTPSKVFQAVHSRRPVFALLHEESTAVAMLRQSGAGQVATFGEGALPPVAQLAGMLADFCAADNYSAGRVDWAAFESHSARNSARLFAAALDEAIRGGARASRA